MTDRFDPNVFNIFGFFMNCQTWMDWKQIFFFKYSEIRLVNHFSKLMLLIKIHGIILLLY